MIPNQQIFPGFFLWVFLKLSSLFIFPGVFQVHIFHFRSHNTINTSPRKLVVSPRPYKLSEFDLSDRQLALTVWKPMGTNLQAVQEFGPHWLQKKQKTDAFPDIKVQIVSQIIPSSFVERPLREWLQFWSLQTSLEKKCRIEKNPWN